MPHRDWLEKFLNVYWLRPENALWRANNSQILNKIEFENPSLDLSCGDGVFSFLQAGGDFKTEFDIFGAVDNLDDFFENADIYNASHEDYNPSIRSPPEYNITVGSDWKPALLDKARALDFYDELVEHDNNDPLPFEDNRFKTVFSNSVYWVENLNLHLKEISRVTANDGIAVLVLKTSNITNFLEELWTWEDVIGEQLIEMIDRGRVDNKKHLYDDDGWTYRLNDAGLEVLGRHPTNTQFHTQLWDVGLRPISPYLIRMAYSMPTERRCELKNDWIGTFHNLLSPFQDPEFDITDRAPAEIIYIVSPNK